MAGRLILADTSVLIEYFRKGDKSRSELVRLYDQGHDICISAITHFEIYTGASVTQHDYWVTMLERISVLPFDAAVSSIAVTIDHDLKRRSKRLGMADLYIAATAVANGLPLATLNRKHFERVEGLEIIVG